MGSTVARRDLRPVSRPQLGFLFGQYSLACLRLVFAGRLRAMRRPLSREERTKIKVSRPRAVFARESNWRPPRFPSRNNQRPTAALPTFTFWHAKKTSDANGLALGAVILEESIDVSPRSQP